MGSTDKSFSNTIYEPKDYFLTETYVEFNHRVHDRATVPHTENKSITPSEKACLLVSRRRQCPIERCNPLLKQVKKQNLEHAQIRTLLDRQGEQILADCQAEIRKHEFQADYDRRGIQKLGETIESQQEELHRAQAEERHRRDQQLLDEQLLKQNWDLREAHEKSPNEMKELKRFQGSTFDTTAKRNWSKIEILSLNSLARYRNCKMKLIV